MNKKQVTILSVITLVAIFGFTTAATKLNKKNIVKTETAINAIADNDNENITLSLATPNNELKAIFEPKQTQFNTLVSLLKDEFENTVLEANQAEYKDFVISKKASDLLTQLDIVNINVNVNLEANNTKVVMFTLGTSWDNYSKTTIVHTTKEITNATAITTNWYVVK